MFAKRLLMGLLIVVLALGLLPVVQAQEGKLPMMNPRPDAPQYGQFGPFLVGIKDFPITFDYQDGTTRESRVTVWYPALNADGKLEAFTYPAEKRTMDFAGPLFFPRTGSALLDAAPDPEGAPYPLIVYSHGGWGYRWTQPEYCEHLASYGFVVLSTDHEDAPPPGVMPPHAELSRQWDISALIDYAAQLTASDGALAGSVDLEQIGVTGYSAGGFTAMLAGGARRNSQEKRTFCTTDEAKNSWVGPLLCVDESARDQEWAKLLGVEMPPDGLWPDVGDPRVDAIVPLDGGAFDFGPEGLGTIRVPALLIFARGAPMAMPYPHDTLLESMNGAQEAIAIFEYADHFLFTHACNEGMISSETIWTCAEPVWDKQRAYDLFHHLATAFLLATLKGDKDAAAALAPNAVQFPGITYKAQGF
jgi:predicted dienelactone hydrolase